MSLHCFWKSALESTSPEHGIYAWAEEFWLRTLSNQNLTLQSELVTQGAFNPAMRRYYYNPVTNDQMTIVQSAIETGDPLIVEFVLPPNGISAPPLHVHSVITETFIVLSGSLGVAIANQTQVLAAQESIQIKPGVPHRFWNQSQTETVKFQAVVTPGEKFEEFLTELYKLGEKGVVGKNGMPKNPAVLARLLLNADFAFAKIPLKLQMRLFKALARRSPET